MSVHHPAVRRPLGGTNAMDFTAHAGEAPDRDLPYAAGSTQNAPARERAFRFPGQGDQVTAIGRPFDPAGKGDKVRQWPNAAAHERHDHDRSRHEAHIGSFCHTFDEPLDRHRFNRRLMSVRAVWGEKPMRVKGVLNVAGESQPLVIHGVHRTLHPTTLLAHWPEDDHRSRLVFIARDLDRATVDASWRED